MAVTHNVVLVVDGKTISAQGDLEAGSGALVKMDTDEITMGQQKAVLALIGCLGDVGSRFEAIITSLSVTAI